MNIAGRLLLLTILLVSGGCCFDPFETEVTFHIPEVPLELLPWTDPNVHLTVYTADGTVEEISCSPDSSVRLAVDRTCMIIALARFGGDISPAGAVLPYDTGDGGENESLLSFRQGFCAELMRCLVVCGFPVETVNYPRLMEVSLSVSGGNPERLDFKRVFTALSLGNLVSRDIVLLPEYELPDGVLPDGRWVPANPLGKEIERREGGPFVYGRSVYYGPGGSLVIWCDDDGWCIYSDPPGTDESGLW